MALQRGVAVRPAGAPMVPAQRPAAGWDANGDGDGSAGAGVADDAREATRQVAREARQATLQVAGQARRTAEQELDRRSTQAGERVGTAAEDARDIAAVLRDKGREGPARIAEQAADRIEGFAGYLREADGQRLISDVRRVARQQPAAVAAGAAVVGIALGRLLKASEPAATTGGGGR